MSALDGTTGFRLDGIDAGDQAGGSVSSAGDVNGDGFDDLIIGAVGGAGESYVVFGGNFTGSAETQVGDATANTLTATQGAGVDILIGGQNDDTLISDGGADVLRGGEGNDTLSIPEAAGLALARPGPGPMDLGPGAQYRLVFVTSTLGLAEIPDITFYNTWVTDAAEGDISTVSGLTRWKAIISTATVSALQNTGTDPSLDVGVPIYRVDGVRVANDYQDLWDGSIIEPINVDESGLAIKDPGLILVHTGSESDGTRALPFQAPNGITILVRGGRASATPSAHVPPPPPNPEFDRDDSVHWISAGTFHNYIAYPIYGISDILTVGGVSVPDFSPRRLLGGNGTDTLLLAGSGLTLDLTTIADNRIVDIEEIDITGNGGNTLTLDVSEVLNISSHSNTLVVRRDNDDTVNSGSDWTQQDDEIIGSDTFEVFTQGAATLKVQAGGGVATVAATVTGQHIFYNNSFFDFDSDPTTSPFGSGNPAANANDDHAIATDKTALLPGETGGFANYTSYSNGLNGIMVDIADLAGTPTEADFEFHTGNDDDAANWFLAPAPTSVTIRAGEGDDGSDRVTIIWPDGEIRNTWLQVTVKATAATGLEVDHVFYYGNAVGETGNAPEANAFVNAIDRARMLNNPKTFLSRATVDNLHDTNRDSLVNAVDRTVALNNSTTFVTDLNRFTVPDVASEGSASANGSRSASLESDFQAADHDGSPETSLLNELVSAASVWPNRPDQTFRPLADRPTHSPELILSQDVVAIVSGVESRPQPLILVADDHADSVTPAGNLPYHPGTAVPAPTQASQMQQTLIDAVFTSFSGRTDSLADI